MHLIKLETIIQEYTSADLSQEYKDLIEQAKESAQNAYAPYSNFYVGAAILLTNGMVVCGNNQENAAYPSGLCAERVALFYAGAKYSDIPVEAIAIVAYTNGEMTEMISPCGGCRQVLLETENRYQHPIKILLCGTEKIYLLPNAKSLLPVSFDREDLPKT